VTAESPTIIATSIGFHPMGLGEWDWIPGPVYRLAAQLANAGATPRLCLVTTALGDHPGYLAGMYAAFGRAGFVVTHLALFPQPNVHDIRQHLLAQDIIWVAGGSVANLLALWHLHGIDDVMRDCWQRGVVLTGVSAGSLCWFAGGTTDSFGLPLRPVTNGLGLLPFANSPHHDAEEQRRPAITTLLEKGVFRECYATDNGAALVFKGEELSEAVTELEGASAWQLLRGDDGAVVENALPTRLLPPIDWRVGQ
jgi:peptidase E